MDDLISRQAAIMAVKTGALSAATIFGRTDEGATAYYETVKAIKALPSVQPERKKGKWIVQDIYQKDMYRVSCSCCGESSMADQRSIAMAVGIKIYNYCPSCGAEMV